LNDTGVDFDALMGVMFAQIRTLSKSFYCNFIGFENAAFLSYFQPGINADGYTIQWQPNENHSCAHNFTSAKWETFMNVPASGRAAVPLPPNSLGDGEIPRFCAETHVAHHDTGRPRLSLSGDPYDCRKRAWYYGNKEKIQSRWTDMFFDSVTNEAAFAYCVPLFNLTSSAPKFFNGLSADSNGMVGTSCTAFNLDALSAALLTQFEDFETDGTGVFVRERSTSLLVAASSSSKSTYFDTINSAPLHVLSSSSEVIKLVASQMQQAGWPNELTLVVWVNATNVLSYPSLKEGDAYYFKTNIKKGRGIEWDIVVVQQVICPAGYKVDSENFMCTECFWPYFSTGGAPKTCNSCFRDFFLKNSKCKECPMGAFCDGIMREETLEIKEGYWRSASTSGKVYECRMGAVSCTGGNISGSYCALGFTGKMVSLIK